MSRFWLWVWILFLLLHLVTLALGLLRPRLAAAELAVDRGGMESLAAETNDQWTALGFGQQQAAGAAPDTPEADDLVRAQEALLRLREMERACNEQGIDVRLADALQAWTAQGGRSRMGDFTDSLLGWLDLGCAESDDCRLERLLLQPGTTSSLPGLIFELAGSPAAMGGFLLAAGCATGTWTLEEMDLNRDADNPHWWMRGSCSFAAPSAP